jgi:hypothetical protein
MQQQVLGATFGAEDARADEATADLGRDRPAQVRATQHRARNDPTLHMRGNTAARGLDFGQFGHDAC